jgi:phage terminase large subunit-like protein
VLGTPLLPWQKWLAIHALELLPDGSFRFRTVVLLVARQNGKSTFLQILALFFLYVRGVALVIGTAQNLDIAEEVWQGAVDIAEDVPELAAEIERVTKVNGKKALELRHGERYKVQAANRRGGRGLSGDLVMLDELREHQTWDAWSAVTKTTMARPLAQVWAVSNAGDASSVVLSHLRALGHRSLGDPDGLFEDEPEGEPVDVASLGVFEWSAPPGCEVDDPTGWVWGNPSLSYTITERVIRDSIAVDPEAVTRTEVLCQWVDTFVPTVIPLAMWAACADEEHHPTGELAFALDVDTNAAGEEWCSIAMSDGEHVEVVTPPDARPGLGWVVPAAVARMDRFTELLIDPKGPAGKLIGPLEQAGIKVRKTKPEELEQASGQLLTAVAEGAVVHIDQPVLNRAVAGASRKDVGDGAWRFSRNRSSVDISPLVAVTLARWGALRAVESKPVFAY